MKKTIKILIYYKFLAHINKVHKLFFPIQFNKNSNILVIEFVNIYLSEKYLYNFNYVMSSINKKSKDIISNASRCFYFLSLSLININYLSNVFTHHVTVNERMQIFNTAT